MVKVKVYVNNKEFQKGNYSNYVGVNFYLTWDSSETGHSGTLVLYIITLLSRQCDNLYSVVTAWQKHCHR